MVEPRREAAVGRLRIAALAIVVMAASAPAGAQTPYRGLLTAHLGVAAGGDQRGSRVSSGAALAVLEERGLGAEVDFGFSGNLDDARFDRGHLRAVMVNVLGVLPLDLPIRPYVTGGVGLLHVHAAVRPDEPGTSRLDVGFNAGVGGLYEVNEFVSLRGDLRYFRHLDRHEDLVTIAEGFLDYWRTSVGVAFTWPLR